MPRAERFAFLRTWVNLSAKVGTKGTLPQNLQTSLPSFTAIAANWAAFQTDVERIMAEYVAVEARVRAEAGTDVIERAGRLLEPLRQAAEDAFSEIDALHRRVIHDIEWNLRKAIEDTGAELDRTLVNIEVAATAAFDFIEAEAGNMLQTFDKAAKAARQGRIVDAVWQATFGRHQES